MKNLDKQIKTLKENISIKNERMDDNNKLIEKISNLFSFGLNSNKNTKETNSDDEDKKTIF